MAHARQRSASARVGSPLGTTQEHTSQSEAAHGRVWKPAARKAASASSPEEGSQAEAPWLAPVPGSRHTKKLDRDPRVPGGTFEGWRQLPRGQSSSGSPLAMARRFSKAEGAPAGP